jgi:adenylate cyclase
MKKLNKLLFSPWTAILTLVLLICIRVSDPSFVESIRLRYFDQLITSKGTSVSQQVHVVNIDDETVRQKGQFPFPRREYAKLVGDLYSRNAGLVVFNIYMPEPDRFGQDSDLAQTFKTFPVVLPQTGTNDTYFKQKYTPFRPGVSVIGQGDVGINYEAIEPNIQLLNSTAAGIGVVNTLPEIDGVTRRVPMVVQSKGLLYPSISLETLRVASGDPSFQVKVNDGSIEAVRIPKFGKITTDTIGRIWVDWSSKPVEHSASHLPNDFGGAIVIVGLTAKGLNNPVATAMGSVYPHYLQAAVLDTVASGTNISRPDWSSGAELLYTIALCIIALFFTRYTHGYIAIIVMAVASYVLGQQLFNREQYLLDVTFPLLTITLVFSHGYVVKFLSELKQKLQIKKQFGSYVNPTVVEMLQKNPELIKLGGERKELSIVMTDLRGFTTLGESFGDDVEGLTQIMNDYMTALSVPVLKNNGTLIKFIGDASLHVHGAPLDDPEHAYTAVITAQQMIQAIEEFNKELQAKGRPPVGMGAGVNTGETLIGNIGSKEKFGYDVLGDSVSTAARLEGQTKSYGVLLIIGPNTNEIVKDRIFTLELDNIAVKGKTVGLRIFTPLHTKEESMAEYLMARQKHDDMMVAYRSQKFDLAIQMCKELMGSFDGQMDHSYELWIERCEDMKKVKLPKDWDGIYRATSK